MTKKFIIYNKSNLVKLGTNDDKKIIDYLNNKEIPSYFIVVKLFNDNFNEVMLKYNNGMKSYTEYDSNNRVIIDIDLSVLLSKQSFIIFKDLDQQSSITQLNNYIFINVKENIKPIIDFLLKTYFYMDNVLLVRFQYDSSIDNNIINYIYKTAKKLGTKK